jgi:hypothetical protein
MVVGAGLAAWKRTSYQVVRAKPFIKVILVRINDLQQRPFSSRDGVQHETSKRAREANPRNSLRMAEELDRYSLTWMSKNYLSILFSYKQIMLSAV